MTEFTTTSKELYKNFKAVSFAMSGDKTRFCLCGACLDYDGEDLKLTATDGHRLHSIKLNWGKPDNLQPFRHIIPAKFVKDLIRCKPKKSNDDDGACVTIDGDNMAVNSIIFSYATRFVDGTYPDYTRVIPTINLEEVHTVRLNTGYLAEIGKAVALMEGGCENVILQLPKDNRDPILINDCKGNIFVQMPMSIK